MILNEDEEIDFIRLSSMLAKLIANTKNPKASRQIRTARKVYGSRSAVKRVLKARKERERDRNDY